MEIKDQNEGNIWLQNHECLIEWIFFSLSYKIEHPGNYKKVNLKELHALKNLVRLISYVDTKHEAS